jgi:NlpC/P60 family putative phage cell wall peptidase
MSYNSIAERRANKHMTRDQIIEEARTWVNTKWVHQASLKGDGCDCVGLVRGVFRELTGKDVQVALDYPATWHLFKKDERLYNAAKEHLEEIPSAEAKPGDVIMFGLRNFPAHHLGILTGADTFIHSYRDIGKVVEQRLDNTWKDRIRYVFQIPEVER